jgi:glycosyltransferase involved in cell wall biosynthesis
MTTISAIIITLNEERNIARCLQSLHSVADEIIVVDSGSTDNTQAICHEHGAKFIQQAWLGYGAQKQFATQQAANKWILNIDADEALSPALAAEISHIFKHGAPEHQAYQIPFTLCFMGREFNKTREKHLRLFNREYGAFSNAIIHEGVKMQSGAAIGRLRGRMMHYSFASVEHVLGKINAYSTMRATADFHKGKCRCRALLLLPVMAGKFLLTYMLRGYLRYGYAGLLWSLLAAHYKMACWCKCLELRALKQ